jgi:hypothetical protein
MKLVAAFPGSGGTQYPISVTSNGQTLDSGYILPALPYSGNISVIGDQEVTISINAGLSTMPTTVQVAGILYK